MLSIRYNSSYNQLMAADESYAESNRKSVYRCVKSPNNMRNLEPISIDKMFNYDISSAVLHKQGAAGATAAVNANESADEEDEISVGCPSPIARSNEDSKEEEKYSEKELRLRSPSCSSASSSPELHCQRSSNSFSYQSEETTELKETAARISESENSQRRYSTSDDENVPKEGAEEYFKPLKRLKMMKIDKTSFSISERSKSNLNKRLYRQHKATNNNILSQTCEDAADDACHSNAGVKSFSICDILSHKPSKSAPSSSSKIVRPWDCEPHEESANPYLLPPPAHRGILPQPPLFLSQFHSQQLSLHLHRPKSDDISSTYETCSSSGRSSTGGSDCCTSPDVLNCSIQNPQNSQHASSRVRNLEQVARNKSTNGKSSNSSPLDALFQMTNKTFDELNGDPNAENGNHLNLFNNRQQPKKKRKSRTAFTNNQIFELERRFMYQKYLSPADRDEIAAQLGLSNAQVITWFQNRRAKLKRDMEELKKDVESSKVLTTHATFLENVQNLGILKKKPISHSDCKHMDSSNKRTDA